MKRYLRFGQFAIGSLLIATIFWGSEPVFCSNDPDFSPAPELQRNSITFIMGEDHNPSNPFYAEAAEYFRLDPTDRTEIVVTSCRSLIEVRDYLKINHRPAHTPWGLINIVVHSNEWGGLKVPVVPNGMRTTSEVLDKTIKSGEFPPLKKSIVDSKTEIRIQGCGLGRNKYFLNLVSTAFGGNNLDSHKPIVRSSRYFLFFETSRLNGIIVDCNKYISDYWYAFYPTGYRPGDIRLARQLKRRYPKANVDWRKALKQTEQHLLGDPFHSTFRLPLKWTVTYRNVNSVPDLSQVENQKKWLGKQKEIQNYMKILGIPIDYFRWQYKKDFYLQDDETPRAVINVSGDCTVLCVLKVFTLADPIDSDIKRPFHPSVTDTSFYGTTVPLSD